jgi:hypothetical protein
MWHGAVFVRSFTLGKARISLADVKSAIPMGDAARLICFFRTEQALRQSFLVTNGLRGSSV